MGSKVGIMAAYPSRLLLTGLRDWPFPPAAVRRSCHPSGHRIQTSDILTRIALLLVCILFATRASAALTLRLDLPDPPYAVGELLLADVVVEGVPPPGLANFQFDLLFDPAVVNLTNPNEDFRGDGIAAFAPLGDNAFCTVVRGTATCEDPIWFLKSTGRSALGTDIINNPAGWIAVAYATTGAPAPPEGSGVLALIEISLVGEGMTDIVFDNVILGDAQDVPMAFPIDGIEGATLSVPEPDAGLLGSVALALVFGCRLCNRRRATLGVHA